MPYKVIKDTAGAWIHQLGRVPTMLSLFCIDFLKMWSLVEAVVPVPSARLMRREGFLG